LPDIQVVRVEYSDKHEIFLKKYWLEALDLKSSTLILESSYKGSSLLASFWIKKVLNFRIAKCPPFTPYNVQIIHDANTLNSSVRYNNEIHLLLELKQKLINFSQVQVVFFPDILHAPIALGENYLLHYSISSRIPLGTKLESLWEKLNTSTRNHILHAQKELEISFELNLSTETLNFILSDYYYLKEGLSAIKLKSIERLLSNKKHIKIVTCRNRNNKLVSTSIFIKSGSTWYYWLNVNNRTAKSRGAPSALLWEGIKIAINDSCEFVFDGSMKPWIMKNFKNFSAETFPYCYGKVNHSVIFRMLNI